MRGIIRRFFKRIKQKYPIEVYVNGRLIQAGSGTITTHPDEPTTIVFEEPLK